MEAMEITKAILIKNLKDLRKERGWNQEDFAEATRYSRGFIADVERGKSWVSPEAIEEFSKAFNVPIQRLFQAETKQENVVDLPIREAFKSALLIPDYIYELALKLNDPNNEAWRAVKSVLDDEINYGSPKTSKGKKDHSS